MDVPQGVYQLKTICDGLAALNKVGMDPEYVKCSAKHVDMISMITDLWNKSAFTPMLEHVYGHQDTSKELLSILTILNTKMDVMTKQIALEHISSETILQGTTSTLEMGSIKCRGELVTSKI